MSEPNFNDLDESIELLSSYHDRLKKEVINVARKLQMPQNKIDSALKKHSELSEIKQTIFKLTTHREKRSKKTIN